MCTGNCSPTAAWKTRCATCCSYCWRHVYRSYVTGSRSVNLGLEWMKTCCWNHRCYAINSFEWRRSGCMWLWNCWQKIDGRFVELGWRLAAVFNEMQVCGQRCLVSGSNGAIAVTHYFYFRLSFVDRWHWNFDGKSAVFNHSELEKSVAECNSFIDINISDFDRHFRLSFFCCNRLATPFLGLPRSKTPGFLSWNFDDVCHTLILSETQGLAPPYLADDCKLVGDDTCRLRSALSSTYVVTRTKMRVGNRSFVAAGPRIWNSLRSVNDSNISSDYRKHILFDWSCGAIDSSGFGTVDEFTLLYYYLFSVWFRLPFIGYRSS